MQTSLFYDRKGFSGSLLLSPKPPVDPAAFPTRTALQHSPSQQRHSLRGEDSVINKQHAGEGNKNQTKQTTPSWLRITAISFNDTAGKDLVVTPAADATRPFCPRPIGKVCYGKPAYITEFHLMARRLSQVNGGISLSYTTGFLQDIAHRSDRLERQFL